MPECTHTYPLGPLGEIRGGLPNEGVSPMVPATSRTARLGRGHALIVAGLLFAGLFGLLQLSPAQAPAKDKDEKEEKKDEKKGEKGGTVGKGPTRPAALPKNVLGTLQMTIVSPGSDVPEMKKVIDEKISAGWTANKVSPT